MPELLSYTTLNIVILISVGLAALAVGLKAAKDKKNDAGAALQDIGDGILNVFIIGLIVAVLLNVVLSVALKLISGA